MKIRLVVSAITSIFLLPGCANLNSTAMSYKSGSTGRVFLWDSSYAAGVGRDNSLCVQGAQTASAGAFNAAVDVVGKIEAGGGFSESIIVLNPASPQTTYANDAYFSICQLAMNANPPITQLDPTPRQNLSGEQIVQMFAIASSTAVQISNDPSELNPFDAPELINYVKEVLAASGIEKTQDEIETGLREAAVESQAQDDST